MRTNIFKSSFLALAMMASFSACTQNEELGTPAPTDEDILNVVAYSKDFVSTDAASRITDNGVTTTFTDGDAIGVFVVRDGEALVSNMKMTLNSNNWIGEANAPLYYYKNADYIAYYPYTANLAVTTVDEIVEYFTSKISADGQATLEEYRNADLMTAEVKAAEVVRGENITFSFAHKMAMLEIKVPVRSYTTSRTYGDENKTFTYKAPLGLEVENGGAELSLCSFGIITETESSTTSQQTEELNNSSTDKTVKKEIYRCILEPSTSGATMNIEGQFLDGELEVYFQAEIEVPTAERYTGINVKYPYDYGNDGPTRDLQPGDYYYSDGSICPSNLTTGVPMNGCVGIIFSTTVSDTDKSKWPHGYVIALENTNGKIGTEGYSRWGDATATLAENTLASGGDLNNFDGYTASISSGLYDIDAVKTAREYSVSLPKGTSGWYLPSAAQLAEVMDNLYTDEEWSFDNIPLNGDNPQKSPAYDQSENQTGKLKALEYIQGLFEKVGGELLNAEEFDSKPSSTITDRWWSTTESTTLDSDGNNKAWCLELKNNGQLKLLERDKAATGGSNGASVRPVFAF